MKIFKESSYASLLVSQLEIFGVSGLSAPHCESHLEDLSFQSVQVDLILSVRGRNTDDLLKGFGAVNGILN